MNIQNIQYRLRKRRLDEIFDFSVLVIRENIVSFLKYSLVPALLLTAFNVWIIYLLRSAAANDKLEWWSLEHLMLFLLILFQQPLLNLPLILLNGHLVFEKNPSFRDLFRFSEALRIYAAYFRRTILWRTSLYTILSWSLLTIWYGLIRNFFQGEIILLEKLRGSQVTRREEALSRGLADRTISFLMLDVIIALVFIGVGLYGAYYFLDLMGLADVHWILEAEFSLFSPLAHLLIFLYAIFHGTAKFIFYLDTRSNIEGWDVELLLIKGVRDTDG